ncbi:MAG: DUF3854 domain-containing protein [Saprospiraceae bacterium]|nr:DUF3854 domain-containing protein [Saprospiraceae bacterium]
MVNSTTSFFAEVMKEIAFDPKIDFGYFNPLPDEVPSHTYKKHLFQDDDNDNVLFNVMDIHGNIRSIDVSEAKSKISIQPIQIRRFKDPGDGPKYLPVHKNQGVWPWISKEIVKAFKEKKKIKRLIITEGYKKAHVACKHGIFCIGFPGITVWKEKNAKDVFHDIKLLVETCEVEDVMWLTDADTLRINWEPKKDLYKRPNSFYTSVSLFKSLCRDWKVNLFYAHIHEESAAKGLDDLLLSKIDVEQLKRELNNSSGQTYHIRRYDITTWPFYKIQELFGIQADASVFYDKYGQDIGFEEFIYRNGVYSWDLDKNELVYRKSGEAAQFVRIMKDYYMHATMPTSSAFVKNTLLDTDLSSIKEMFKSRNKTEVERILKDIEFYHGFFNEPGHLEYKQKITTSSEEGFETHWYNRYMKITHKAKQNTTLEDIPVSFQFIKHIFGEKEFVYKGAKIQEWELGFDYIQLLYLRPKQMLPILSLLSKENQTGKSMFWKWMVAVFQQNARIVPPEMLMDNFTAYFVNCLLIAIDEALLNKRETMEKVKAFTTQEESPSNEKNVKRSETQTFLKIGLSSNNIDDFAIITKNDQRFWIRDVPQIPKEHYIIDFYDKLCAEIPALLGYLSYRSIVTPNEDRMWFHPDIRKTEGLERVIAKSRPANEVLIEHTIKNYMTNSFKLVVNLGLNDLKEMVGERSLNLSSVKWIVEDRWNKRNIGYSRKYEFYNVIISDFMDSDDLVQTQVRKTNYYTFHATEFWSAAEIINLFPIKDIREAEEHGLSLKSSITAEAYMSHFYKEKAPPFPAAEFIKFYNSKSSFTQLYNDIDKAITGEVPF